MLLILVLTNLVMSDFISERIWSRISFAVNVDMGGAVVWGMSFGLNSPCWVRFGFTLFRMGHSSISKIIVHGLYQYFILSMFGSTYCYEGGTGEFISMYD